MRRVAVLALGLCCCATGPALAAGPPPLSGDSSAADVASAHGSGSFGRWLVDGWGLPVYRYTMDPDTDPRARQPELGGKTDAWHQLGNDHIVATAHNRGYVQLWSQDRIYQWTNRYDAGGGHYSGGYGYLRVGDRTISTLYADRPPGGTSERDFGAGYFRRRTASDPVDIEEYVYAPFGDDPLLLHDVTIRNTSSGPLQASWFEYWGVNPHSAIRDTSRGLAAPAWDAGGRTLSVAHLPEPQDTNPLSVFAAVLQGPVEGFETTTAGFFGSGGRANPDAVAADQLPGGIASSSPLGAPSRTLFALRAPVALGPGESVTLRYAYGASHAEQIPGLVDRWRAAAEPLEQSQQAWRGWLPRASFEGDRAWLQRELQWDAYTVRSGTTYEEACGHHILSQGGYYQYDTGFQGAFRDPLQHVLPLIYSEPWIAREVLRYSAKEQPQATGLIPYAMLEMCTRFDFGSSNDLDLWLLLAAAEYGLATRDLSFFDEQVPWSDGGEATLWEHLKLAYRHQESQRGPHGGYITGVTGDWSDFETQFLEMTESTLVSAQLTYVYPRLAELAEARGDSAFAAELRADAAELREVVKREWTGKGWFSRGYSGERQLGQGAIFGEPQPWGILGGATSPERAATLVANIRRFLTGIGAPAVTKGPARIGSSQSPARNDPDVTERTRIGTGVGSNNAVYVGGAWYAVNGWLTWALGELDRIVPGARGYALDELERNTLAAHAAAYPDHWSGVISVDDACNAHYEADPSLCGIAIAGEVWNTQILHQPAWSLFDTIKLAGIDPVGGGYRIDPHLPMRTFSLRLPVVGVAAAPGELRGYVRPERSGSLDMEVRLPEGASPRRLRTYVEGRRVGHSVQSGFVRFSLPTRAGEAADWAVTGGGCLARRSPIGPRNIGRVRLGLSRRRLARRVPAPVRRTRRSWRWCVRGGRGTVSAAFSRGGRVALVSTTAPSHGNRGVRPGGRAGRLRRAYRARSLVRRGLYRATRRSPRLIGVRGGRIRYIAVTSPRVIRDRRALRTYLSLAGLRSP